MADFFGRKKELQELGKILEKKISSLVVIRGRRRIGKSRLIREFCNVIPTVSFAGIPPTKSTTAQSQREEFARQMQYELKIKKPDTSDWGALFGELVNLTRAGPIVIVLDEISWLGSKDSDFLGKLKNAWDLGFSKNDKLILILCGSVSSWIEKNILSNTGFVGRISLSMCIKELFLRDCAKFWKNQNAHTSPYEIFKILSITGGVPRYLEEIIPNDSAEENINRLCFSDGGLLFSEFERIFSDLFSNRSEVYKKILLKMSEKNIFLKEVFEAIGVVPSGSYVSYLTDLEQAGFISRDYTWDIKTGKDSNLSRYRLSDNYVRFYLKAIYPHKNKIVQGNYDSSSIFHREGWKTTLGLQFENLVLNNVAQFYEHMHVRPHDVLRAGPFFQRPSTKYKGCQIDLLIQTVHNVIYLVEIKFSKNEVSGKIKNEVKQKMDNLVVPKGYSVKPVLIHVNGVSDQIFADRFFAHVVDFSDVLSVRGEESFGV